MHPSLTFVLSLLGGTLPAVLWLWFWLHEDKIHPEPKRKILLSFLLGMLAVILVLPIEKTFYSLFGSVISIFTLVSWAAAEEILKYLAAFFSSLRSKENDEPIDPLIYMISASLGFSALENSLFLSNLLNQGFFAQSVLSGNMRFIGASLLHTLTGAIIGIFMSFSFYKNKEDRKMYLFTGIILSIVLHTVFNSLIIKAGQNLFFIFGGVWLLVIGLIFAFEKIKSIKNYYNYNK